MCRHFTEGRCIYGDRCYKRHDHAKRHALLAASQPATSTAARSGVQAPPQASLPGAERHYLCPYYLQGTCKWGEACRFEHPDISGPDIFNFLVPDSQPPRPPGPPPPGRPQPTLIHAARQPQPAQQAPPLSRPFPSPGQQPSGPRPAPPAAPPLGARPIPVPLPTPLPPRPPRPQHTADGAPVQHSAHQDGSWESHMLARGPLRGGGRVPHAVPAQPRGNPASLAAPLASQIAVLFPQHRQV